MSLVTGVQTIQTAILDLYKIFILIRKHMLFQPPLMEAEEIITLFDSIWFLSKTESNPQISPSPEDNPQLKTHQNRPRSYLSSPNPMAMTMSEPLMTSSHSLSPNSVLFPPALETTLSEELEHEDVKKQRRIRLRKSRTKSLSELEFEEVKGFMDLGFVFSEEDRNSRLVEIIPGLQRMEKKKEGEESDDDESVQRPYLSEAWEDLDKWRRKNLLIQWRMPGFNNEIGMKNNLKKWAHTVAATIR